MKQLTSFFFLLLVTTAFAQKKIERTDTLFYNKNWEICERPIAAYYRIGKMIASEYTFFTGEINDYYINNTLQMNGTYDAKGLREGVFTYYYPNGKIERQGKFVKNVMMGPWNFYDKEGHLKLQADCKGTGEFSILFLLGAKGDTMVNNGNGNFSIDIADYGDAFRPAFLSGAFQVTHFEGSFLKGAKDGIWRYYYQSGLMIAPPGVRLPKKEMLYEEQFSKGKFVSGLTFDPGGRISSHQWGMLPVSLTTSKDKSIDIFNSDYIFQSPIRRFPPDQTSLINFLFNKTIPFTTALSTYPENSIIDYIRLIRAAVTVATDHTTTFPPDNNYTGNGWLILQDAHVLRTGDTVPANTDATISFWLQGRSGNPANIEITGAIDKKLADAVTYYLSRVVRLFNNNSSGDPVVKLSLKIEHTAGYSDTVRGYVSQGVLKYAGSNVEYVKIETKEGKFFVPEQKKMDSLYRPNLVLGVADSYKLAPSSFAYLDENGLPVREKKAKYMIVITRLKDSTWQFSKYNMHGPLISAECYKDENKKIAQGSFAYYDDNGEIDSIKRFVNGLPEGEAWYYNSYGNLYRIGTYAKGVLIKTEDCEKGNCFLNGRGASSGSANDMTYILNPEITAVASGGQMAWQSYLRRNIRYPEKAIDRRTKGTVKIMFSVDEKGKTGEYIVTQSVAYVLDEEVIRLIDSYRSWIPAIQNGKKIKSYLIQPLVFRMD